MSRPFPRCALLVAATALPAVAPPALAQNPIRRASVALDGTGGNDESGSHPPSLSADGRHVAFDSEASNFAAGDTNFTYDVFVRDRLTGALACMSVAASGMPGNGASQNPKLSADGRWVAFSSYSSDLVAGDGNQTGDVFLRDRDPDGDGLFDEADAFTIRVSQAFGGGDADDASWGPAISGDGQLVAFATDATNVGANDQNGSSDVYLHDRADGTTKRMSLDSSGKGSTGDSGAPTISADGAFVAFASNATKLVPGDLNGHTDVFVRDRLNGITERVSVSTAGVEGNLDSAGSAALSADGRWVAFQSWAFNLVTGDSNAEPDIFLRDRATGTTTIESLTSSGAAANRGAEAWPALSADGQLLTFQSESDNLATGDDNRDADLFLRDRATGTTLLLSANCQGEIGTDESFAGTLSPDGSLVAFASKAVNFIGDDGNGVRDVFVLDRTIAPADAGWSSYGAGFPGTWGVPSLALSADPVFDTSFTVDVGNSAQAFTAAFLLVGESPASIPTKDGGTLLVNLLTMIPLALWPSGLSLPADIPDDVDLCGLHLFLQVIEIDPGAASGLSFSDGLELVIGN